MKYIRLHQKNQLLDSNGVLRKIGKDPVAILSIGVLTFGVLFFCSYSVQNWFINAICRAFHL